MWYLDNDCSRHMMGDKNKFVSLKSKERGYVTCKDNSKVKISGIDFVHKMQGSLKCQ